MSWIYIEDEPTEKVKQTRIVNSGERRCTIAFVYPNSDEEHILYCADPNCDHEIQAQWSGIKCIKCGGWYCA